MIPERGAAAKAAAEAKETDIRRTVLRQRNLNHTKEEAKTELQFIFELDEDTAGDKIALYWNM